MTRDLLESKIETILRYLRRIKDHTPNSVNELSDDSDDQDIISLNLERAIQACVDIASHIIAELPDVAPAQTMSESFALLAKHHIISEHTSERLKRAVGFRNISVHDYQAIDWNIVFMICTKHLSDFETFIKEIQAFAEK